MTLMKTAAFAAFTLAGSTAISATSLATISVTNNDGKAHVLVVEDAQENITEMPIAIGQTIENLCQDGCFLWLKEIDEAQYVAQGTIASMTIRDGKIASSQAE